jgi:hypothetical protein
MNKQGTIRISAEDSRTYVTVVCRIRNNRHLNGAIRQRSGFPIWVYTTNRTDAFQKMEDTIELVLGDLINAGMIRVVYTPIVILTRAGHEKSRKRRSEKKPRYFHQGDTPSFVMIQPAP